MNRMYSLVDQPFENSTLKEELEALIQAQAQAADMGGFLVTESDKHFLPRLEKLAGVKRSAYRGNRSNSLVYEWTCEFGEVRPVPGAPYGCGELLPFTGAKLPKDLQEAKQWSLGEAALDYSTRTVTIRSGELVITFPSVNLAMAGWTMLNEINAALVAQNAGVMAWKIYGLVSDPGIRHLYPDGAIPSVRNDHAQAVVTGYARTEARWNAALVYIGAVAHKTAIESLHATLLQWKPLSLDGNPVMPEGHFRLEVAPLTDFSLFHAALVCDAALPGKWAPQDERAYALVFKQPGQDEADVEALLEKAVMTRLREVLPHPVREEWAHPLFIQGTEKGLIDRLDTGGDCLAGVRIHLDKDWTAALQDLLVESILTV